MSAGVDALWGHAAQAVAYLSKRFSAPGNRLGFLPEPGREPESGSLPRVVQRTGFFCTARLPTTPILGSGLLVWPRQMRARRPRFAFPERLEPAVSEARARGGPGAYPM